MDNFTILVINELFSIIVFIFIVLMNIIFNLCLSNGELMIIAFCSWILLNQSIIKK